MSSRRAFLGVDLGTQSVRATAVDDDGTVLAAAARPLHSDRGRGPDGTARHEQDPGAWCRGVAEALAEVSAGLDGAVPTAVAVDGTSGTVVLTDAAGRPLTPGVMYDDARGARHTERIRDAGAEVWDRLGQRVGESWALPTLLALLPEHPGARVLHQTDVVTRWLAGRAVATDTATALKTGYDAVLGRWPHEVLGELGIDPAALPEVVLPGRPLGGIGAAAAEATGLPEGTRIVAGMTDGCAAQLGAGAVAPGSWNAVLGTTLVLKGVTTELLRDPDGPVYCHRGPQGGWWLPGGASSTGAGVLSDVIDPSRFDDLTGRPEAREPGLPVAYPLAGRGERFPFDAPEATGFWLDGGTPRPLEDLVGAVGEARAFAALCEGVAHLERLAFDHVTDLGADVSGHRTISGGATRNRWWNQRRADVQGVELRVPRSAEPAFGMALLAAAGAEAQDTGAAEPDLVAAADRMVGVAEVLSPRDDPALEERHGAFLDALADRGWLSARDRPAPSGGTGR